jgi:ABC-type sugar transport system substrate-binding protein
VKKLRIVVSVPGDTLYLRAQTAAAQATVDRLDAGLEVLIAQMDSVAQGQQLLKVVQSRAESRPDAIIMEPVSAAGLPRVAEAAVAAGIAWVVSNAQVDYIAALRKKAKAPVFQISQDHMEVGQLQGKQVGAILPGGGSVLYLRGPAMSWWASKRFEGMERTRPRNVEVRSLKVLASTADGACGAVSSWLDLTKQRPEGTQLIVSQNTDFLTGAKKAFEAISGPDRAKWLALPRTGVGVVERSRPLVDQGVLSASVVTSLTMDRAVEMLARAIKDGSQPLENTFVEAYSYPSVEDLAKRMSEVPLASGDR